jgi:hypothetical protein
MSEENVSPESENTEIVETRIQISAVDEDVNIADAKTLRLTVEGDPLMVGAMFEIVLGFTQSLGGQVDRAYTASGEDITSSFVPPTIDLLDAGDEPVA